MSVAVAARRRRRTPSNQPPMVRPARGNEATCGKFLRTTAPTVEGVVWEQRCSGPVHGDDERHRPGLWIEISVEAF